MNFVSIIIGFKNRDIERVINTLNSFEGQTDKKFELIFVNYGSEEKLTVELEITLSSYSFIKYVYVESRGLIWNRSHALNIGILRATGDLIVFSDIDLIVPVNFIENIKHLDYYDKFYTFQCYYLPKYHKGFNLSEIKFKNIEFGYVGLCSISLNNLCLVNYFNEFYQLWGLEDDDLYRRLEQKGINRINNNITQYPIIHQYHDFQKHKAPTLWSTICLNNFYSNFEFNNFNSGKCLSFTDRPALSSFFSNNWTNGTQLSFYDEPHLSYYLFYQQFAILQSNDLCFFNLSIDKKRKNGYDKFFKFKEYFINNDQITKPKFEIIKEFIFYFIGVQRDKILDYYFHYDTSNLFLILIKK